MYCDRCGTPVSSTARFCTSCGRAVIPSTLAAPPRSTRAPGRVRQHIHRLATLWLLNGILRLLAVGWFLTFGPLFFPFLRAWGGPLVFPFGRLWGTDFFLTRGLFSLGIFLGLFGVLHLVLAWGLWERQPWARILGLILGFLALLRFPLGTALGVYTLWVLLPEESSYEYDRLIQQGVRVSSATYPS